MKIFNLCLLIAVTVICMPTYAQDTPVEDDTFRVVKQADVTVDETRTFKDAPTHPPIRLTPDKSEIIRLDQKVGTVIVGNPAHLSVLPSTSQGLILVGKYPGATHFMALDKDENIIMQRHVIVAAPKTDYVRVRKTCAKSDSDGCKATSLYYCPDACHETQLNSGESDDGSSNSGAMMPDGESDAAGNGPPSLADAPPIPDL